MALMTEQLFLDRSVSTRATTKKMFLNSDDQGLDGNEGLSGRSLHATTTSGANSSHSTESPTAVSNNVYINDSGL